MSAVNLRVMQWELAVCKLDVAALPAWANGSAFLNFTLTDDEVSLVCEAARVPDTVTAERGWSCIKVDGVLDFSLVGIIARLSQLLAAEAISIFVLSTYNTDYVLVKQDQLTRAKAALVEAGYRFLNS